MTSLGVEEGRFDADGKTGVVGARNKEVSNKRARGNVHAMWELSSSINTRTGRKTHRCCGRSR